jgi:hypothetical protein
MPERAPRPDPTPSPSHSTMLRFWRIFRLLGLLSIVIAAIAVMLVARGDRTIHIHMLVATALGIGMTVLVGTGLMTLVFISNSSGHDEAAAKPPKENEEE